MAKQWHQLERLDHKSLKKLQQEREKALQAQKAEAERKRLLITIGAVLAVIICIAIFLVILRNRAAERAFKAERAQLLFASVTDLSGKVLAKSLGDWEIIDKGLRFDQEYTFKTEKEGFLVIELQRKNMLKLLPESELVVFPPTLEDKENRVIGELAVLNRGEVTVSIALDGRELLEVEAGGVVALGASGLYKVLYNHQKKSGEVVVKNGLVEVFSRRSPEKRVKVSGFYKVTFQEGQIANPTQASVIQYDWR
ncbi:MAG: hypothetical protein OZSIB_0153 [Candidatus Ozemobacter sibiricus]|jgi:hypothetical protein|uniref:FecR protein domain-containing protein n=1 Tax=Candidatus Ozemobacter sibiricus TaxID=2268124 RepID=A0A367ZPH4_9BACT|nr:MAG: hypothetical protein OZSIB_0153 [Candidatus Ozemobacter sibiricus]